MREGVKGAGMDVVDPARNEPGGQEEKGLWTNLREGWARGLKQGNISNKVPDSLATTSDSRTIGSEMLPTPRPYPPVEGPLEPSSVHPELKKTQFKETQKKQKD